MGCGGAGEENAHDETCIISLDRSKLDVVEVVPVPFMFMCVIAAWFWSDAVSMHNPSVLLLYDNVQLIT